MEPPVFARIGMGLVPRIYDRPPVHRIDAHQHAKKVSSLRNLKNARLASGTLTFNAKFSGTREDLSGN